MELFPGRTLEELDDVDWGRVQRAMAARGLEHTEEMRKQQMAGKVKELSPATWKRILWMDAVQRERGSGLTWDDDAEADGDG